MKQTFYRRRFRTPILCKSWIGLLWLCAASGICAAADIPTSVRMAEQQRIAAIARVTPATICVFSPTDDRGGGSGVILSPDGYAVSNFHVTAPSGDYMRCGLADGKLYDAVIVSIDPTGDVALIKLLGRDDFPTVPLGDSDTVEVGQPCFAVGNPFALASDFQPSVTYGIVSGTHRYQEPSGTLLEYTDCIQTDASINPGNSGGPLFNAQGELIGINGRCSFEKRGRVNVGVGYAISINQVKNFMGYLRSGRVVDHATAGFSVATRDRGQTVVSNILRESDAYRRGIRDGDQILSFANRDITSANAFKNILGTIPNRWRVPVTHLQDGTVRKTHVRLEGVHTREELLAKIQPETSPFGPQPGPQRKGPDKEHRDKDRPPHQRTRDTDPAKMPEHVGKYFEARRGYANFAFNRQEQDRVGALIRSRQPVELSEQTWTAELVMPARGATTLTITSERIQAVHDTGRVDEYDFQAMFDPLTVRADAMSLPALLVWQRLLTRGLERFGDVYYLGTAPLPDRPQHFDVLVGTIESTETLFYVEPRSGEIAAIEVFLDVGTDPVELTFHDPFEQAPNLPSRIEARWGNRNLGSLRIMAWQGVEEATD